MFSCCFVEQQDSLKGAGWKIVAVTVISYISRSNLFSYSQLIKGFLSYHLWKNINNFIMLSELSLPKHYLICHCSCWKPMIADVHSLSVNHLRAQNHCSRWVVLDIIHWSSRVAGWKPLTVAPAQLMIPMRLRRLVNGSRRLPAIIKYWDVRWDIVIWPLKPVIIKEGRSAELKKNLMGQLYLGNWALLSVFLQKSKIYSGAKTVLTATD